MEEKEIKKYFKEIANKISVKISDEDMIKFFKYKDIILDWNSKINLTTIVDEKEFIIKHFIDSLTINKYIENNRSIIDIGTGAGFPGIPIKIMNENNGVILMDSLNKRLIVLNEVIEKLELKNIETLHGRAEEIFQNKNYREKYDIAISRAVANLNTLLELMIPSIKVGGKCICMKGKNAEKELDEIGNTLKILGGKIVKVEKFILPETDYERAIIIIEKTKETPAKYPRKPGIPQSKPIV